MGDKPKYEKPTVTPLDPPGAPELDELAKIVQFPGGKDVTDSEAGEAFLTAMRTAATVARAYYLGVQAERIIGIVKLIILNPYGPNGEGIYRLLVSGEHLSELTQAIDRYEENNNR